MPPKPAKPSITYITSGAAGMYCGSCMHDNALAVAMTAEGYETILVPTYTPIRTDEKEVTIDQVFFGGINVYLQQKIPLFRFVPKVLDRFLDSPKLIRKVTAKAIETDAKMLGALTVSMLRGKTGNQKKEVRRLVKWLVEDAKPDVIVLSNVLIAGFIRELKQSLNVPVIVTLQGDDSFLEFLSEPYKSQAIELIGQLDEFIDGYLVHSNFYADRMSRYCNLSRDKMYVTPLGIDTSDFIGLLKRQNKNGEVHIGYLARLSAEKGLHNLVSAFIHLKQQDEMEHVKLQIAGWLGKDNETFCEQQFARLVEAGLENDFQHLGSVDRAGKLRMLSELDILCVPTDFREPKGIYVLEALACGIPVVKPAHGVFPELIKDLGGGLLYAAEENDELSTKLCSLVKDKSKREQLGAQGREAVLQRRNGKAMADATIAVVNQVLAEFHSQ